MTTTSTGSGEHFCGGVDGCQYAITPTGHFHFYELDRGWQKGKLGTMWNPYYFNGSIAVHGLAVGADLPRVARVRAHPDARRRLLLHTRAQGRVGVRLRHAEAGRQRLRRPGEDAPTPPTAADHGAHRIHADDASRDATTKADDADNEADAADDEAADDADDPAASGGRRR